MSDRELLREFLDRGSESAFQLLAQRHVDLVYATALRRLGDAGLAEETTQNVFIALARRAPLLRQDVTLAGWLYKATLLEASRRYRDEQRRRRREEVAVQLGATMKQDDSLLKSLAPVLDDAMLGLRETDRQALLLRFFEGKNFRDIARELGIGEDAAQKRVARSLDQLTRWFRRRGYAVPATTAVAALLHEAAKAAPSGLAALAAHVAMPYAATTSLSGLGLWLTQLMILSKAQTTVVCLALLGAPVVYQWHALRQARTEQQQRVAALAELRQAVGGQERSLALLESRGHASDSSVNAAQARLDRLKSGEASEPLNSAALYTWEEGSEYVRLPKSLVAKLTFAEFEMQPRHKAKPERVQLPTLGRDGAPSPALLSALGCTSQEAQAVDAATRKVFADFQAQAAQHGDWAKEDYTMTGNAEHKTWLTQAIPEAGGQLKADYFDGLTQTLGQERTRVFAQQAKEVFRDVLNEFGQVQHAVSVGRQQDGTVNVGEMYFNANGSSRLNSSGGNIPLPEPLKPYYDAWKQAALTSLGKAQP